MSCSSRKATSRSRTYSRMLRSKRHRSREAIMNTLQAQRDVQSIVFGPYDSRRFGRSLGVNPLPPGSRLCNFDCIYCECASGSWPMKWELRPQFPTPGDVHDALRDAVGVDCLGELDA